MKKIYLVRHGETDFNKFGIAQGSGVDSDLNETGHQQANAFFEAYKHIPFEKVYTSTLKRTHQSIHKFIHELKIPHIITPSLDEMSWGYKEGRKTTPEEEMEYIQVLERWGMGDLNIRFPGGETPLEVAERQKDFIEKVLKNTEEKLILVCSHGRALKILLCQLLNYPLSEMEFFLHTNLCLYELTYTGSMFIVNKANYQKHLLI
jgi:probable phosphoglycerate mutase